MKLHGVIAFFLIIIALECFGGFSGGTRIKVLKEHVDPYCLSKEVLKRSMRFETLSKRGEPVRVPTYDFFYASKFPYGSQGKVPLFNTITLAQKGSKELVGIMLVKEQADSLEFDIICSPQQRLYAGMCYANYYPATASSLKEGDYLVCLKAKAMQTRKIRKIYTISNPEGTVFIPRSKVPLCLLVSKFGVASYIQPTIDIEEEK